jgi:putative hydrolase of the HAD superfamily
MTRRSTEPGAAPEPVDVRSERILVNRFAERDIAELAAHRNDPALVRFQGWTLPYTEAHAAALIERGDADLLDGVQLAIRLHDGTIVGDMMVSPAPGVGHVLELGITVGSRYQGRGYATEALRAMIAHLFTFDAVHKLMAYVATANAPSLRVFDRLGFRREGLSRDGYRLHDGSLIDEVLFGLTRPEWSRPAHDFDIIAFDADDTLWKSEDGFRAAELGFVDLIGPYVPSGIDVKAALTAVERKNLHVFGYGVKAFGLSMVEAAVSLAGDNGLPPAVIGQLVEVARAMLTEPVHLLPGVASVLEEVGATHRMVLITKGDLIHQSAKIEASGLAHHFSDIEIVMEKDAATYSRIITRLGVPPSRFCMVGNSVRSDVLPVLSLGGSAVHVPYPLLWDLEQAPADHGRSFAELASLTEFPAWLRASTTAQAE